MQRIPPFAFCGGLMALCADLLSVANTKRDKVIVKMEQLSLCWLKDQVRDVQCTLAIKLFRKLENEYVLFVQVASSSIQMES